MQKPRVLRMVWPPHPWAVGGRRVCLKPPEPLSSLCLGLGTSLLNSLWGRGDTDIHSVLRSPWSPGAQLAVPMATVPAQMGAADCDGRWGHQAGNLRAGAPLSLEQTARECGMEPYLARADPHLSSCPPPAPAEPGVPSVSTVSLMMDDPGLGGQGSQLLGPPAERGWGSYARRPWPELPAS